MSSSSDPPSSPCCVQIFIEYAKDDEDENAISVRISAYNRGPEPADLHILPQLFFKNYWSWPKEVPEKPTLRQVAEGVVQADHPELARKYMYCSASPAPSAPAQKRGQAPEPVSDEEVQPQLLFTENETNFERLYGGRNTNTYAKDGFHDYIIPTHRLDKDRPQLVRKTRPIKRQIVKTVKKPGNLTRATTAKGPLRELLRRSRPNGHRPCCVGLLETASSGRAASTKHGRGGGPARRPGTVVRGH